MASSISNISGSNMARTRAQILRTRPTHLLNLPPELRINEIYKYLLPSPKDIKAILPWNGMTQKRARTHKTSSSTGDDATQQKWSWTTLLLVNRELHDEIEAYIYGNMEICLLLTPDTTINENHAVFSKPQTFHDIQQSWGTMGVHLAQGLQAGITPLQRQDYQMQLMLLEQQNKRRLLAARQHQIVLNSLASSSRSNSLNPAAVNPGTSNALPSTPRMDDSQPSAASLPPNQTPPVIPNPGPYLPSGTMEMRQAQQQVLISNQQRQAQRQWLQQTRVLQLQAQITSPQALQPQQHQPQPTQWAQPTLPTPVPSVYNSGPSSAAIQPSVPAPMAPAPAVSMPMAPAPGGHHALQDYQMQLMLLEQERKKSREFREQQAKINLTAYSRDERDGFLHSCCNEKSASRARILQIRHVPYPDFLLPLQTHGPDEIWCFPVADRYKALVGTVRVVCDFVINVWESRVGDESVEDVRMRMSFVLVDVVEKFRKSGIRSKVLIEMCVMRNGYEDLLWDRVQRLLTPFERCHGVLTPEFERLLWIDQSESRKEELVSDGKVKGGLYEPCSSQFGEFLEEWKSKVTRDGPTSPFPVAVTACHLIDEFISQLCLRDPITKRNYYQRVTNIEKFGLYSDSSLLAKKAVEGKNVDELKKMWRSILDCTWKYDEKLMMQLIANGCVERESPKKRGKSVASERNLQKLRQLYRNINEIVEGGHFPTAVVEDERK